MGEYPQDHALTTMLDSLHTSDRFSFQIRSKTKNLTRQSQLWASHSSHFSQEWTAMPR